MKTGPIVSDHWSGDALRKVSWDDGVDIDVIQTVKEILEDLEKEEKKEIKNTIDMEELL